MTDEEALRFVDVALNNASLGNLQEFVFRQVWHGRSYAEIACSGGYSPEYVKRVGSTLWRSLSHALGEKVTKSNIHSILRRYATQRDGMAGCKATGQRATINQDEDSQATLSAHHREDDIDISHFYGRTEELNLLKQWIVSDRCQLITLLGMAGMGKTVLAAKLAEQIQGDFEFVSISTTNLRQR